MQGDGNVGKAVDDVRADVRSIYVDKPSRLG